MSYQVLARKWRPKNFSQLMGQEHVVTILSNALSQNRLHHAYLFTGTRGVGKTTIARIFAKSLNCVEGVTAEPCGKCDVCLDIDQGSFVDLLEIDAASRTKVDDTREILENVQYAPSRGRFKVYLIDEVHMLSRSSFNALLKTLEEPPEHVKFILATTDPQKLPITVLSRCLQFHLKALTISQIVAKLSEILTAESVTVEPSALSLLAKAARGSMRDSLSLTDQAIAQGQGNIVLSNVQQMLGGIDQNWPFKILIALIKQDAQQLMLLSQEMACYSPNYTRLFAELIQLLHQVAMYQIVPHDFNLSKEHAQLLQKFAQAMSPEDVQLYYQIAVNGRKDLPYAGDEQAAFDMALLRLLAFKPVKNAQELPKQVIQHNALSGESSDTAPPANAEASFDEASFVEASFDEVKLSETNIADAQVSQQSANTANVDQVQEQLAPVEAKLDAKPSIEPSSEPSADGINVVPVAVDDIEEESGQAYIEQQLASEMLSIEQDAENLRSVPEETVSKQSALEENLPVVSSETPHSDTPHSDKIRPQVDGAQTAEQQIRQAQHIEPHTNVPQDSVPQAGRDEPTRLSQHQQSQGPQSQQPSISVAEDTQDSAVEKPQAIPQAFEQIDSPIGDILKQRNLLRSRKKQESTGKKSSGAEQRQPTVAELQQAKAAEVPALEVIHEQPFTPEVIDPSVIKKANQVDKWANMIDAMALNGRLRQLAIQATIDPCSNDDLLVLNLNQKTKHLKTESAHTQLIDFVSHYFARAMQVDINIVEETVDDPYQIQSHINDKRYEYAKQVLRDDEIVQQLQSIFQAELDETSVIAK